MTTTVISQALIETVEQDAQEALVNFLQEVKAPEWVSQVIEGLRLLDATETANPEESNPFGVRGYNAQMAGILNQLITATYQRPGEPVTIPA